MTTEAAERMQKTLEDSRMYRRIRAIRYASAWVIVRGMPVSLIVIEDSLHIDKCESQAQRPHVRLPCPCACRESIVVAGFSQDQLEGLVSSERKLIREGVLDKVRHCPPARTRPWREESPAPVVLPGGRG
jgi:hypothetical protein